VHIVQETKPLPKETENNALAYARPISDDNWVISTHGAELLWNDKSKTIEPCIDGRWIPEIAKPAVNEALQGNGLSWNDWDRICENEWGIQVSIDEIFIYILYVHISI